MKKILIILIILFPWGTVAQEKDTTTSLQEVVVYSFEKNRSTINNPDALVLASSALLSIYQPSGLLNAMNALPGVRMEERSPGSFRLAIRGSALRSPFGVRNVKVYWNNLPLTDAGNNTYFSILEPGAFSSLAIAKGPSGGLYGSGTGGTVLLNSIPNSKNQVQLNQFYSTLGGFKHQSDIQFGPNRIVLSYQDQKGFRQHSDLNRYWISFEESIPFAKTGTLNLMAYASQLSYETPGGLTLKQYQTDGKQARPAAGPNRGAVEQKAKFTIQSQFLGLNLENQWSNRWAWNWGNTLQINSIKNPTIRNYEERIEPNFASRGVLHFKNNIHLSWDTGLEYAIGQFNSKTFGNFLGSKDTLQTELNTNIQQITLFSQVDYALSPQFSLTFSGSLNHLNYEFKNKETLFSPRFSVVYLIHSFHSIAGKISHGFSPPSIAELRPSTGVFTRNLRSEKGWNKELIYRGKSNTQGLSWTINAFQFNLDETIAMRTADDGGDYYINAGSSIQKGIEAIIEWIYKKNQTWISYTYQDFTYKNYTFGKTNYSENRIPGIPRNSFFLTEIFSFHKRLEGTFQIQHTGKMFLNDANSETLPASTVLNSRINYFWNRKKGEWKFWISGENLSNLTYTLGPDLNAFGNRFYNLAPGRNFSLGIQFKF